MIFRFHLFIFLFSISHLCWAIPSDEIWMEAAYGAATDEEERIISENMLIQFRNTHLDQKGSEFFNLVRKSIIMQFVQQWKTEPFKCTIADSIQAFFTERNMDEIPTNIRRTLFQKPIQLIQIYARGRNSSFHAYMATKLAHTGYTTAIECLNPNHLIIEDQEISLDREKFCKANVAQKMHQITQESLEDSDQPHMAAPAA